MDMMSDFDKLDLMFGSDNFNPIERELANAIEGSTNHYDIESNSHPRGNLSHENEFRDFTHENTIPRQDRSLETMETFTIEINLRLSRRNGFNDGHDTFTNLSGQEFCNS